MQQHAGVMAGRFALKQYAIVACAFSFKFHLPRGDPKQWLRPVQAACQGHQQLPAQIAPLDMGGLVTNHHAKCFRFPMAGVAGQDDFRSECSGGDWNSKLVTDENRVVGNAVCKFPWRRIALDRANMQPTQSESGQENGNHG